MKRFHVHLKVTDLEISKNFYTALFQQAPVVEKNDYAKWLLDNPALNFALSVTKDQPGIEHLGFQASDETELAQLYQNMKEAKGTVLTEGNCTCCYAKSEKSWLIDPQSVPWEVFYTHGAATVYGSGIALPKN
ncbi:MAG: hypothetical protein Q8K02_00445 [Flavobacterium sp.]|nr:hypothetical protein [Flavobacterium sp.]